MTALRNILVTGATGYIGSNLCRIARERGISLTLLGRRPPQGLADGSYRHLVYDLKDPPPDDAFIDVDAIIHMAAAVIENPDAESVDVRATERLRTAAAKHSIPSVVFLSSQSARPDAATAYGRSKYAIEAILDKPGDCTIRVGMVYGGPEKGVFGTLSKFVCNNSIIPVIAPDAPIQPVHVDELCNAILDLAARGPDAPRLVRIGAPDPIPFMLFLDELARAKSGRKPVLIPIPRLVTRLALFLPGNTGDRINGLLTLQPMQTADDLVQLGITVKPYTDILKREAAADALVREGRTLLRYILATEEVDILARRYADALEALGEREPLPLSPAVHRRPRSLRFLETIGAGGALADRLHVAMNIAEASPEGFKRFLRTEPRSPVTALFALAAVAAKEALFLPIRLLRGKRGSP